MDKDVLLEEITRSDLPTINSWRNDYELNSMLGSTFRFINIETDEQWFESYMRNRGAQVRCAIRNEKGGSPFGLVSLTDIDQLNRMAQIQIQIGNRLSRGKGVGSKALAIMVRHGFCNLNLNRIYAYVLSENQISLRLFKGAKFQEEGQLRQAAFKNGSYRDLMILSILRHEFSD